jgi:hypothetical protein
VQSFAETPAGLRLCGFAAVSGYQSLDSHLSKGETTLVCACTKFNPIEKVEGGADE